MDHSSDGDVEGDDSRRSRITASSNKNNGNNNDNDNNEITTNQQMIRCSKCSRAGGPVTCVGIIRHVRSSSSKILRHSRRPSRCVPPHSNPAATADGTSTGDSDGNDDDDDDEDRLLLFSAQGPYITRYELRRNQEHSTRNGTGATSTSTRTATTSSSILAFDGTDGNNKNHSDIGGTIHGIHFVHGRQNEDKNDIQINCCNDHENLIIDPGFDTILYGGKKIVFGNFLSEEEMTIASITVPGGSHSQSMAIDQMMESVETKSTKVLKTQDWVWSVKTTATITNHSIEETSTSTKTTTTTTTTKMAVGFARHMIEIWDMENSSKNETESLLHVTFLQRISMAPSTLVTSIDLRFVVDNDDDMDCNKVEDRKHQQHPLTSSSFKLIVASGDSFHNVWVTTVTPTSPISNSNCTHTDNDNNSQRRRQQQKLQQHLRGHKGVVHDVKFSDCCTMLVSCSDDRSVRLWNRRRTSSPPWNDKTNDDWEHAWVAWGHTARIWSVSFVFGSTETATHNKEETTGRSHSLSQSHCSPAPTWVVSVSEDGTARFWDVQNGTSVVCIHHTSASSGLWSVDALCDFPTVLVGATDGTISTFNIYNYTCVDSDGLVTKEGISIPDDRAKPTTNRGEIGNKIDDTGGKNEETQKITEKNSTNSQISKVSKKKKNQKSVKQNAQMIVGMKWWDASLSKSNSAGILIATREGSLMFNNVYAPSNYWIDLGGWCDSLLSDSFSIHPNDGCCMSTAQGKSVELVAVGTTKGDVVVTFFPPIESDAIQEGYKCNRRIVYQARQLKSVQGLEWVYNEDGIPSFLISFHVKSVAIWKCPSDIESTSYVVEEPLFVMHLGQEMKGIPSCCSFDEKHSRVVVGDTRGNLALFALSNKDDVQNNILPVAVLPRIHKKAHVTSVRLNEHSIISSGHDGCLHVSYLNGGDGSLETGWSFPVYGMTGVTNIISTEPNLIVSGYFGNTFIAMDASSGQNIVHYDTGGRQRILDCQYLRNGNSSFGYNVAVCSSLKDGTNSLAIQGLRKNIPGHNYEASTSHGVNLHGETIFGASAFTFGESLHFFITGSEDCTAKISSWKNGYVVDSIILAQQESCIRCISISQMDKHSVIVAVGGGNFVLQFFLIGLLPGRRGLSVSDLKIQYMGKGSACKRQATIDHRINAVKAIPLEGSGRDHLVIAGDSNGNIQLYLIPEETRKGSKNTVGLQCPTSCRPILCIDTVMVGCRVVVLIGTTGGNVIIYDLPGRSQDLQQQWGEIVASWKPLGQYQGHQMGTNAISAHVVGFEDGHTSFISVVTCGDDQALSICDIQFMGSNSSLQLTAPMNKHTVREASLSALKDVKQIFREGERYVVCVGYSQMLSVWSLGMKTTNGVDGIEHMLTKSVVARLPVDLGDINCLAVCCDTEKNTGRFISQVFVAVCGMGIEMFEIELSER